MLSKANATCPLPLPCSGLSFHKLSLLWMMAYKRKVPSYTGELYFHFRQEMATAYRFQESWKEENEILVAIPLGIFVSFLEIIMYSVQKKQ